MQAIQKQIKLGYLTTKIADNATKKGALHHFSKLSFCHKLPSKLAKPDILIERLEILD